MIVCYQIVQCLELSKLVSKESLLQWQLGWNKWSRVAKLMKLRRSEVASKESLKLSVLIVEQESQLFRVIRFNYNLYSNFFL